MRVQLLIICAVLCCIQVFAKSCTADLPKPEVWNALKGTQWTATKTKTIITTSNKMKVYFDKCRSSMVNRKYFYNFGDALTNDNGFGFLYGFAAFSSLKSPWVINLQNRTHLDGDMNFAPPLPGTTFLPGFNLWGMDTSNVADTGLGYGVGFVWEIQRVSGKEQPTHTDGGAIIKVTTDGQFPLGTRIGPVAWNESHVQVGLLTVFKDPKSNYIYTYTAINGGYDLVIGRVLRTDALDIKKYHFLKKTGEWANEGVPLVSDANYAIKGFLCHNAGSMMWSKYFRKYLLFCGHFMTHSGFWAADTPYGPWTGLYYLNSDAGEYGIGVHPWLSNAKCENYFYFTAGVNNVQNVWKVDLDIRRNTTNGV